MTRPPRNSARRTSVRLILAGVALAAGCGAPPVPSTSSPEVQPGPSTSSTGADRSVLVVRAYSGGFATHAERTDQIPAEVVVFDDGVAVAEVGLSPEVRYSAIQLTQDELQGLKDVLQRADPMGQFVPYDPAFHVVSEMTIIQVHNPDRVTEVAIAGLYAALVSPPPEYAPPWAAALDAKMTELRDMVRERGGIDFADDIPTVDGVEPVPGQARSKPWAA